MNGKVSDGRKTQSVPEGIVLWICQRKKDVLDCDNSMDSRRSSVELGGAEEN